MKKVFIALFISLFFVSIVAFKYLVDRSPIFTGFAAKNVASGIFVAERSQESIEAVDINFFPVNLAKTKVDKENKIVTSSFFGLSEQVAVYRPGFGCALVGDLDIKQVSSQMRTTKATTIDCSDKYWPLGDRDRDTTLAFVNEDKLQAAMAEALKEGNTRSVLVAYDTLLKWEQYADGFEKSTPLLGWSMTKSITSTMLGVLAKEGKIELDETSLLEEWEEDERANISLRQLLTMTSGLDWEEDYGDISEVTIMLYQKDDLAKYAIHKSLSEEPGKTWLYSSGSANILSEIIKRQFADIHDYWDFPYEAIFGRIGMHNAVMETDAVGTFVGSSYTYASTREWARYGLLYQQRGLWFGDTIISPQWVDFTSQEAPHSEGKYGAQFWLNLSGHEVPDAPKDTYFADGYQGQRIYIIPSKKLVIVRFGISKKGEFDYNKFVSSVLDAFEN